MLLGDEYLISRWQYHVVYMNAKTENECCLKTGQIAYQIRSIKWTLFRWVRITKPPLNTILRTYVKHCCNNRFNILSLTFSYLFPSVLSLAKIYYVFRVPETKPSFISSTSEGYQYAVLYRSPGEFSVTSSTLVSFIC